MTIRLFVLDRDPVVSASLHTDRDVLNRCVGLPSMLSAVHKRYGMLTAKPSSNDWLLENGRPTICPASDTPLVLWAGETEANYAWLRTHFRGFLEEYQARYGDRTGKRHSHWDLYEALREAPRPLRAMCLERPFAMTAFPTELYDVPASTDIVPFHRELYRNSRSSNRTMASEYFNRPLGVPDFMQ